MSSQNMRDYNVDSLDNPAYVLLHASKLDVVPVVAVLVTVVSTQYAS